MEKSLLTTPILERLFKESQIFNFFQAARLLENYLLQYYSTGAPENLDV